MAKSKTREALDKDIKPALATLNKEGKAELKKLSDLYTKLKAEVARGDKADKALLKLYLKTMTTHVGHAAEHLDRLEKLQDKVEALEPEDDMGPDFKAIEEILKSIGDIQQGMKHNMDQFKKVEDQANDLLEADSGDAGKTEALKEKWATVEGAISKRLESAKRILKIVEDDLAKGLKLQKARDPKLYDLQGVMSVPSPMNALEADVKGLEKMPGREGLDKAVRDQLERDLKTFPATLKEIAGLEEKSLKKWRELCDLKIEPPDVKKAATILKIPSTHVGKLKDALGLVGTALEKALDALAKELKLGSKGKDMAAALKKAGVL